MLYDAKLSQDFAARLQDEGIFVTGFYYRGAEGTGPYPRAGFGRPHHPSSSTVASQRS